MHRRAAPLRCPAPVPEHPRLGFAVVKVAATDGFYRMAFPARRGPQNVQH
eukprot:SAG31_NODE_34306_length_334_cov_0.885106_1_plen_49_part_01